MNNCLKAILFDLDNTLTDFVSMKREATRAAAKAMIKSGLNMDEDQCFKELFQCYWQEGIDNNTAFEKFIKSKTGKEDRELLEAAILAYLGERKKHLKPYPKIKETLLKLKEKGIILGILSDAPKIKAENRLRKLGLYGIFSVVITFDDTGELKPSKLPFLKAIEAFGVKPDEVLMVGDSIGRDVKGAQDAGMKAALAKWGEDEEIKWPKVKGLKADYELNNISELAGLI
ncbi:Glyceraldehyde 3-phosphate phosphatase [Candidatus Gugararchaeum adminiculabundum]|nr:Glyceraldehyde 3-phosphate phosphatase [Candidatus Gugararchaeum adminiculabundum]